MNFGAPIFFYGLAAIAIPVVIHLWSKNTKTKVAFGSLRFLRETETKTTKHLWPSELLLLLIRVLVLAALVLALADPLIEEPAEKRTAHLIDPSLGRLGVQKIKESLDGEENIFWLSPKITSITDSANQSIDTWTTLKSFAEYDSLVIYSQLKLTSFQSNQTSLHSRVNWIEIPSNSISKTAVTLSKGGENYSADLESSSESMTFSTSAAPQTGEVKQINVYLKSDPDYAELSTWLQAALRSIDQKSLCTFNQLEYTETTNLAPSDWLVWLSREPVDMRKKLIYLSSDVSGFKLRSKQIYTLAPSYSIDEMLSQNFPLQLESALTETLNEEFDKYDVRTIPAEYLTKGQESGSQPTEKKSLAKWSLVTFLVLLGIERIISQGKLKK